MFQLEHYLCCQQTVTIASNKNAEIVVAAMDGRDGGLTTVLPSEGWTLKEGWSIDWSAEGLSKVYSKTISAGDSVSFTTSGSQLTGAIFALEGKSIFDILRIRFLTCLFKRKLSLP